MPALRALCWSWLIINLAKLQFLSQLTLLKRHYTFFPCKKLWVWTSPSVVGQKLFNQICRVHWEAYYAIVRLAMYKEIWRLHMKATTSFVKVIHEYAPGVSFSLTTVSFPATVEVHFPLWWLWCKPTVLSWKENKTRHPEVLSFPQNFGWLYYLLRRAIYFSFEIVIKMSILPVSLKF